jgi:hypothetical protein
MPDSTTARDPPGHPLTPGRLRAIVQLALAVEDRAGQLWRVRILAEAVAR